MKFGLKYIFLLLALCLGLLMPAQKKQSTKVTKVLLKKYTQAEVLDSIEGIKIYNKLIAALNGDSTRLDKDGSLAQGWREDYYINGKLLHKGFYKDGKLDLFRNFYENGKNERVMASLDPTRVNIDVYYDNGNQRKQTNYYNAFPQKISEFYVTGLLKTLEEYDNVKKQLTRKKTWYASGQTESEMTWDPRSKKYLIKTYHPNGKIHESGQIVFSSEKNEFFKSGIWTIIDEEGKNKHIEKFQGLKSDSNQ